MFWEQELSFCVKKTNILHINLIFDLFRRCVLFSFYAYIKVAIKALVFC